MASDEYWQSWSPHAQATMKLAAGIAALSALALCGCQKSGFDQIGTSGHGRYVGVGHYSPGPMWTQIAHADQPKDPAGARITDDDQVIIVMDSNTGEVRQCGNLSGVCVEMNPWSRPVAASQSAPVSLSKHAGELGQGAQDAPAAGETPPH
ncbi:MAG TPA: hypothetical protein VGH03_05945 [Caulobacteraceae bacterium]|jgi:hypothetical protein